ncbi:MAG TPA: hypothetical protein VIM46_04755 [Luteolibacter sp.]
MLNVILFPLFALSLGLTSVSCKKQGPAEKMGNKIDDALDQRPGEKVRDAVEDAVK